MRGTNEITELFLFALLGNADDVTDSNERVVVYGFSIYNVEKDVQDRTFLFAFFALLDIATLGARTPPRGANKKKTYDV